MFKAIIIVNLIFCAMYLELKSGPPCMPEYDGLYYSFQKLSNIPQLTTDMPYEVMLSYLLIDTMSKNYYQDEMNQYLNSIQQNGDTIKKIIKLSYITKDYNPIIFQELLTPRQTYKSWNQVVYEKIASLSINLDTNFLIPSIYISDYILHIKVLEHNIIMDSSAILHKNECRVKFQVIDTIKGKLIPTLYNNNDNLQENFVLSNMVRLIPEVISEFQFRLSWARPYKDSIEINNSTDKIYYYKYEQNITPYKYNFTKNGEPLIKDGDEAIVFLKCSLVCSSVESICFDIIPSYPFSHNGGIFLIKNGKVINEGNDFGIGEEVDLLEFKNIIKNKINTIKGW